MKINFKSCNSESKSLSAEELAFKLERTLHTFVKHQLNSTISLNFFKIIPNGTVALKFPGANSKWASAISLLLLLINTTGLYYTTHYPEDEGWIHIRPVQNKEKNYASLIEIIENNMDCEISICK